jgi:hypothetical protein
MAPGSCKLIAPNAPANAQTPDQTLTIDDSDCGQVLTRPGKTYKVVQDMECAGGGALEIGADQITVNLNGHALRSSAGTAIDNSANQVSPGEWDEVKIMNGSIVNFFTGIENQGDRMTVSRVTFVRQLPPAGVGVALGNGQGNKVMSSLVIGDRQGIFVAGDGALLQGNEVARTTAYDAIELNQGNASKVIANRIAYNDDTIVGYSAIEVFISAPNSQILNNKVVGNGTPHSGVDVGSAAVVAKGNSAERNAFNGLRLLGMGGLASGNRANWNGDVGILADPAGPTGANKARGNQHDGGSPPLDPSGCRGPAGLTCTP